MPGYGRGRPPKSKGRKYPPEPLHAADVAKLLNGCVPDPGRELRWDEEMAARRLRALIALLWRTGLRISEALDLIEGDLDIAERTVTVRSGKGGKRRIVAMDDWAWVEVERWLRRRRELRPGAVFCVLSGPTEGRAIHDSDVRRALKRAGERAGLRRRINPHAFRHTMAVSLYREGVRELVIQQQLGHARLDVTQLYLRSLDPSEILEPVSTRKAPVMPVPHAE
jgi:integrase